MKTATWTKSTLLALLTALALGCSTEGATTDDDVVTNDVGAASSELITTGAVMISPWNIGFNACNPTMQFWVSPLGAANVGFLAIDVAPTLGLNLSLFTIGAANVLTPLAGITPLAIDAALLTSVRADITAAAAGITGLGLFMNTPALLSTVQISTLSAALSVQTQANLVRLVGAPVGAPIGIVNSALRLALSPITASTMLLPNLGGLISGPIVLGATFLGAPTAFTTMNLLAGSSLGLLGAATFPVPFGVGCLPMDGFFGSPLVTPFISPLL